MRGKKHASRGQVVPLAFARWQIDVEDEAVHAVGGDYALSGSKHPAISDSLIFIFDIFYSEV